MAMFDLPLAYVGPESALPVASVLAGVVGLLLLGWRFVLTWGKRAVLGLRKPWLPSEK
jgi:hypothetical protein